MTEKKNRRCPECNHIFPLVTSPGNCPRCDGSGTNLSLSSPDPNCRNCGGSGRCPTCEGCGEVARTIPRLLLGQRDPFLISDANATNSSMGSCKLDRANAEAPDFSASAPRPDGYKPIRMVAFFFVLLLLLYCSASFSDLIKIGEESSKRFHSELDLGNFEQIYLNSSDALRKRTQHDKFVEFLARVRSGTGKCSGTKLTRSFGRATSAGRFCSLSYMRSCEKGVLYENFEWEIVDGKGYLMSYLPRSGF